MLINTVMTRWIVCLFIRYIKIIVHFFFLNIRACQMSRREEKKNSSVQGLRKRNSPNSLILNEIYQISQRNWELTQISLTVYTQFPPNCNKRAYKFMQLTSFLNHNSIQIPISTWKTDLTIIPISRNRRNEENWPIIPPRGIIIRPLYCIDAV